MIYYNLTQCSGDRVVYFRSTDIEQKNYERLLWSVPDEWFFLFYKGEPIHVVDKSTHKRGKIERIFIPVLNDLLNAMWFGDKPKNTNLSEHFLFASKTIHDCKNLRRRFDFWFKKISNRIIITCATIKVDKEDNPI